MTEAEIKAEAKKLLVQVEGYLKLAGNKIDTRTKTFLTSLKAHTEHFLEPEKFKTTVTSNTGTPAPTTQQKPPTTG